MSAASASGMVTGARLAVAALERAGVELAFGLPGVHNLALWRALGESPIRLVGVRHEQTAAYAADGYARATGRLGVALTTTGPGAANTLAAVGEAWASRQPLLVIATDIPTTVRRPGVWRGALHEATDQAAMFEPLVKRALRAHSAAELGELVAEAAATALAAPSRPVYLEIPTDLLSHDVPADPADPAHPAISGTVIATGHSPGPAVRGTATAPESSPGSASRGTASAPGSSPEATAAASAIAAKRSPGSTVAPPEPALVARAAELIGRAERPLVWAGGGALQAGAGAAVAALAERLVAPVITTYSARGLLPPGHPCLADAPPHVPAVGELWDAADLIIAVGSDFDGMTTQAWKQPQPPTLVAINVDRADAAKNYLPHLVIEADAAAAAHALAERLVQRPGLEELGARMAELRVGVRAELARTDPEAAGFLAAIERVLPANATVVCDMCIPGYWLGGFLTVAGPRRLAYPLGWGTLGCGFPQGIGAALAGTGPVVSVSGDGGFLYAAGELATLAQETIPLTAVIVDDGGYGMLRFDQDLHGDPHEGVDLLSPDFVALAEAFGVHAEMVDGLGDDFAAALTRQLALARPSVLVARAALGPPPNVSPRWYRR